MDDLRQKLFPIFLNEAERNLEALRQFLSYQDLAQASADELETAFRAAHTLKGTANLVKADSICKIARRLEAMLEKHFEAQTVPTPVEHEALKLATDWVAPLVSALQGDLQEPTLFVSEALQALDLAEAFPGRTPLVELLDSQEQNRAPQLDDPFADDPELFADGPVSPAVQADPFAEDPAFGMEFDLVNEAAEAPVAPESDDPFAEDDDLMSGDIAAAETAELGLETAEETVVDEPLPFDPFAEDYLGLGVDDFSPVSASTDEPPQEEAVEELESLVGEAVTDLEAVTSATAVVADPFAEDEFDLGIDAVASSSVEDEAEAIVEEPTEVEGGADLDASADLISEGDPFAEDDDFSADEEAEDVDEVDDPFSATPQHAAMRVEEIAESLLLPNQESSPRKDYVCCVFRIGERDYYLPIKQMKEITDLPQVLPLPLAPPMVSGLINLRGDVLPVINLAILNNHQQAEVRVQRRLVVAEYQGESLSFLADGVPYLGEEFNGEKVDMAEFLSLYSVRGVEK